ncbi:M48 family metalloprotease [soil metagenome]
MIAAALATVLALPSQRAEAIEERAWFAYAQDVKTQDAEERHQEDLKRDREMGAKYSQEADKELKPSEDKEMTERVQRIGQEMAKIADANQVTALWGDKRLNSFDYTFKLVQGKDVNAFSLPGGYIYVYEGLVKYVESDDELAGVLGHEVAHASFRHIATLQREQSKLSAITLPLILLAILAGGGPGGAQALTAGQLVNQAVGSGWSVKAEKAADYGGFQYMLHSKYNPTGMLTMMERLARDEKSGPAYDWGIYRTHPPGRERAEALSGYMKEAGIPIQRSAVTTSFRTTEKPGDNGTIDLFFGKKKLVSLAGSHAIDRAEESVTRLNAYYDAVPELFSLQIAPDGTIIGRNRALIELTPEDAQAAKVPLDQLRETTLKNVRSSLFNLAFRIWDRV